jgi:hypothetical protein
VKPSNVIFVRGHAIRDLESGQELRRFPFTNQTIRLVEFSPVGEDFVVLQDGPTQRVVIVSSTLNGLAALSRNCSEQIAALAGNRTERALP